MKTQGDVEKMFTEKLSSKTANEQVAIIKNYFGKIAVALGENTITTVVNTVFDSCPVYSELEQKVRRYGDKANALTEKQLAWLGRTVYQKFPGFFSK